MKNFIIALAAVALATPVLAQDRPALKDTKDKASYSIGLSIGTQLKQRQSNLNGEALAAGMRDGFTGTKPLLSETEMQQTMDTFQKDMMKTESESAQKNAAEGEKFLAENKSKAGVKTTASGLQYKVEKGGSGAAPKETDQATVNYRGTLINGTEFDSSYSRGKPATFGVNQVIPGWTEALKMMKPGAKYQLFVPANLAYGKNSPGGAIGPNSALIFEVELISVQPSGSPSASPSSSR